MDDSRRRTGDVDVVKPVRRPNLIDIVPRAVHRIEEGGPEDPLFIEVHDRSCVGRDYVVCFADDYGGAPSY
jgi:hypothetical protein